jgi:aerobic-type carbon monoxide dehydrogenase small subunit (CoxS/CutS family)
MSQRRGTSPARPPRSASEQQVVEGMNGNLCRCATYSRIIGAVQRAAEIAKEGPNHA